MLKKRPFFVVFFCWMVVVTYLSLTSLDGIDSDSLIDIPHLDKLVHFTFYFVATILGTLFLRERTIPKMVLTKAIVFAICFAISYGILMEILQQYSGLGRDGDLYDIIANSMGAIIGAGVAKKLIVRKLS